MNENSLYTIHSEMLLLDGAVYSWCCIHSLNVPAVAPLPSARLLLPEKTSAALELRWEQRRHRREAWPRTARGRLDACWPCVCMLSGACQQGSAASCA